MQRYMVMEAQLQELVVMVDLHQQQEQLLLAQPYMRTLSTRDLTQLLTMLLLNTNKY